MLSTWSPDEDLATCAVQSPVGALRLVASPSALVMLTFPEHQGARPLEARAVAAHAHPILRQAAAELAAWLAGKRRTFEVPLAARGTPFQRAVWEALAAIPYGEKRSYSELAEGLGRPLAARAVAAANAANPISIIVPCHRVIGRDGNLTGYAGGLAAKAWLLGLEARAASQAGQKR